MATGLSLTGTGTTMYYTRECAQLCGVNVRITKDVLIYVIQTISVDK